METCVPTREQFNPDLGGGFAIAIPSPILGEILRDCDEYLQVAMMAFFCTLINIRRTSR